MDFLRKKIFVRLILLIQLQHLFQYKFFSSSSLYIHVSVLWVCLNMYIYSGWLEVEKFIFFNSHISEKQTHRNAFKY